MCKKAKKYDDDDGRVIADMNVEGMPWNNGYDRLFGGGFYKKKYRRRIEEQTEKPSEQELEQLKSA